MFPCWCIPPAFFSARAGQNSVSSWRWKRHFYPKRQQREELCFYADRRRHAGSVCRCVSRRELTVSDRGDQGRPPLMAAKTALHCINKTLELKKNKSKEFFLLRNKSAFAVKLINWLILRTRTKITLLKISNALLKLLKGLSLSHVSNFMLSSLQHPHWSPQRRKTNLKHASEIKGHVYSKQGATWRTRHVMRVLRLLWRPV